MYFQVLQIEIKEKMNNNNNKKKLELQEKPSLKKVIIG